MLGPFATASRRTPIHQVSRASMSTTTTTTTRDRGDRYGLIEWTQQLVSLLIVADFCDARPRSFIIMRIFLKWPK